MPGQGFIVRADLPSSVCSQVDLLVDDRNNNCLYAWGLVLDPSGVCNYQLSHIDGITGISAWRAYQ